MEAMPFLLRLSFEGMVFAVALPWFWGAVLVALGGAWWVRRSRQEAPAAKTGRWPEVLIPFAFPVAILLWASVLYASLEGQPSGWYWQELGIDGLLLAQVLTVVWLLARHRIRLRPVLAVSVIAIWWAFGASFVAGVAIYNDWL